VTAAEIRIFHATTWFRSFISSGEDEDVIFGPIKINIETGQHLVSLILIGDGQKFVHPPNLASTIGGSPSRWGNLRASQFAHKKVSNDDDTQA
jgi:hypothetical protein